LLEHAITLTGHTGRAYRVAFSSDGRMLASSGYDGTLRIWSVAQHALVHTLDAEKGWYLGVAWSPDGGVLASGGAEGDNRVRIWDTHTWRETSRLPAHGGHIEHVTFSPDGSLLASSSGDGTVRLWACQRDWSLVRTLACHDDDVGSAAFSRDGRWLVTASDDGRARTWEVATGAPGITVQYQADPLPLLWAEFTPTGDGIVTAGYWMDAKDMSRADVRVWDASSGALLHALEPPADAPYCVIPTPDGLALVGGSADGQLLWWDLGPRGPVFVSTQSGHDGAIYSLAWTPDGRTLASCGFDGTVRLWHPARNT